MSGVNSIFSLGHGCYRQAGIPATDGAATGVNTSTGGATNGGDFEAAQRLATVQSCHTTLQTVAEASVIPNYNLRYAKRSTQNIKENKRWCFQEAFLFSPCFQENITGNVQLKKVMFERWLKSREAPHSQTLIWLGKSLGKKLWNDICSPAITFENVITMIQNSIITPFAFIFLYSFIT